MFKTISAALLAASIVVAPAMAAGTVKTDVAPVTKVAPTAKVLDAKASMRKHVRHRHHIRHHRVHKHSVLFKKHRAAHVVKAKPVAAKIRG